MAWENTNKGRELTSELGFTAPYPTSGAAEQGFGAGCSKGHVGPTGKLRLERAHELAQILRAAGAGLRHQRADLGVNGGGVQTLREIALENDDLGGLFVHQILAPGRGELRNGVAALLDHFVDDRHDGRVVQLDALVDFFLLHRGHQQANGTEQRRVFGAHGGLHVILNTVFDCHGESNAKSPQRWAGYEASCRCALLRCAFRCGRQTKQKSARGNGKSDR